MHGGLNITFFTQEIQSFNAEDAIFQVVYKHPINICNLLVNRLLSKGVIEIFIPSP